MAAEVPLLPKHIMQLYVKYEFKSFVWSVYLLHCVMFAGQYIFSKQLTCSNVPYHVMLHRIECW